MRSEVKSENIEEEEEGEVDFSEVLSQLFMKYRGEDENSNGMSIQSFYDLLKDAMLIQTSQV